MQCGGMGTEIVSRVGDGDRLLSLCSPLLMLSTVLSCQASVNSINSCCYTVIGCCTSNDETAKATFYNSNVIWHVYYEIATAAPA